MDTNNKIILDRDELESALFPVDELFSLQVNHKKVKYEFLIGLSSINRNTYLVNINSKNDLNNQLIPFLNGLASFDDFDGQVEVLLYPKDQGHSRVLDKDATIKLIKNHFQDEAVLENQINDLKHRYSNDYDQLEKELEAKEKRIIELQTTSGYLDYKIKNISMRLKNRLKTLVMKIQKPYYELHQYLPVDYNKLTVVIPYRKSGEPEREMNLDITLRYLSHIGVPNLIISEHSDSSAKDFLMEEYKNLFKSFQVIHTDAHSEVFNRAKARNVGIINSNTPYIATSDLDCLTNEKNIKIALGLLARGYEVIHPFNRRVTDIIDKKSFIVNYDFKTVQTPEQKRSTADGGIIFWNKHSFVSIGMENEYFLGWGGEDNEIMYRANLCGLKQYRIDDTLYHLYHHRPQIRTLTNVDLEAKTRQMNSRNECLKEINQWPWVIEAKKKFSY